MNQRARPTLLVALTLSACGPANSPVAEGGETTRVDVGTSDDLPPEPEPEPEDCGYFAIQAVYVPPTLMFVVDASPSMLTTWDHDGDPNTPVESRWLSARGIVEDVAQTWDSFAILGLQRFPSADACPNASSEDPSCADASACTAASPPEVTLAETNAAAVLAALPGPSPDPVEFAGASPAAAAYASALAHVESYEHEYELRPEFMVLLTDGRTNCSADLDAPESFAVHDPHLRDLVEHAFNEYNITTAVIAVDEAADPNLELGVDTIPGFDPRPALHELGVAGGIFYGDPERAYLRASDRSEILQVLDPPEGAGDKTCVIELNSSPDGLPAPEQIPLVTWRLNGELLPYLEPEACATQVGWTWESFAIGEIVRFCGQACDELNDEGLAECFYGCPSEG